MEIDVKLTASPKAKPQDESNLGFGKRFTDHMFIMEYEGGKGWVNPRIEPYHRLSLDPASSVFHYAQEIFEGLKAYRADDGRILMFRSRDNCRRLNRSAERMCMPPIDVEFNYGAMRKLVEIEREWVPHAPGTSLYLRPTMIANDEGLGVHAAKNYIYYVICAPSGAYYPTGLAPISILVEDRYVRAVRGGMGEAKTGGNYACSIKAGEEAQKKGYSQVLWLDGETMKYVQEVGAMNMMFVYEDRKIVTPVLNGSILPGITRDSVLKLGKHLGYETEEARMDIHDVIADIKAGRVTEAFGTGTAAVVSPVNKIRFQGEEIGIGDGGIGHITQHLYDVLTGIQFGKTDDPMGWVVHLK